MMLTASIPGRTVHANGKEYLYFGGTAYLGLPTHPGFQELVIKNIRRWGTAYGSSRNANVQISAYQEAESALSELVGSEAALTLSSGMLAGKLAVEALSTPGMRFFYFPGCHPAIMTPGAEPFYQNSEMHPDLLTDTAEEITLLTDAIPSMQVVPIDLSDITKISPAKKITLLVDESHSLGIVNQNGRGILAALDLPGLHLPALKRKILVASLGKAYGLTGGVIASDQDFISQVKETACFIAGAGMNPAFAQSFCEGKAIFTQQLQLLRENTGFLYGQLPLQAKNDLLYDAAYPVIYPQADACHEELLQDDIVITHFQYPSSRKIMNRIVLSAHHTPEDLDRLAGSLTRREPLTRRVAPDG